MRPWHDRRPRAVRGLSGFHTRALLRAILTLRLPLEPVTVSVLEGSAREEARRTRGKGDTDRACRARLRRQLTRLCEKPLNRSEDPLPQCDALSGFVGLEPLERDLFVLSACDLFERLVVHCTADCPSEGFDATVHVAAAALEADVEDVKRALAPEGRLRRAGLVDVGEGPARFGPGAVGLRWLQADEGATPLANVFSVEDAPRWTIDDFAHVALDAEILRDQLRSALAGRRGVRIGMRGPAGAGRRSLVRAVVASLGASTCRLRVPEGALDADDVARLSVVSVAREGGVVLLVEPGGGGDDDVPPWMRHRGRRHAPRASSAPPADLPLEVPLVYVIDDQDLDAPPWSAPAQGPRVDLTLHLPKLPSSARERAIRAAVGLDAAARPAWLAEAIPSDMPVADVARIARAVLVADAAHGATLDRQISHLLAAETSGGTPVTTEAPKSLLPYDLSWIRTDTPADALVAALGRGPRGCMLFHGAPGTGKSALAREIARRNGRPVVIRTASQLISKYLGESEKMLAAAFAEATAKQAVLILDEADSYLWPRKLAQRSFETTQVNEMLVQIERMQGWLVCTTNFIDGLDEAALRRFSIKVGFSPPSPEQRLEIAKAAAQALGLPWRAEDEAAIRAHLLRADGLTPGDVSAVVERVQLVGGIDDAVGLAERFALEKVAAKKGAARIGFG